MKNMIKIILKLVDETILDNIDLMISFIQFPFIFINKYIIKTNILSYLIDTSMCIYYISNFF